MPVFIFSIFSLKRTGGGRLFLRSTKLYLTQDTRSAAMAEPDSLCNLAYDDGTKCHLGLGPFKLAQLLRFVFFRRTKQFQNLSFIVYR
jgi:hypothetical protein